ncbi:MAG: hypothetical protein MZV63_63200 [Marinilabiliales bacterium]|nr:hypothetical protein [Marinilabiliales bacterium]
MSGGALVKTARRVIEPGRNVGIECPRHDATLDKTVAVRDKRFLLRVETSHESADYRKYEDLREEIWGYPDDHMSSTRNMMCENVFHEGGSLFIGAFAEARRGFEAEGPRRLLLRLRRRPRQGGRLPRRQEPPLLRPVRRGPEGVPELRAGPPAQGVPARGRPRPPGRLHHHLHLRPAHRGQRQPQHPSFRHGRPRIPGGHLRRVRRPPQPPGRAHRPVPDVLGPRADGRAARLRPRSGPGRAPSGPGRRVSRVAGKSGPVELEVVEGTDLGAEGEVAPRPHPPRLLPDAPGDRRRGRRDQGRSRSTGAWPRARSSRPCSAAATGSSISSRRSRARPANHYVLARPPASGPMSTVARPFVETRSLAQTYLVGDVRVAALDDVTPGRRGRPLRRRHRGLGLRENRRSSTSSAASTRRRAGTIEVDGCPHLGRWTAKRWPATAGFGAGMIFQSFNLIAGPDRPRERRAAASSSPGVDKKERKRRAAELLDQVGLAQRAGHRPAGAFGRRAAAGGRGPGPGQRARGSFSPTSRPGNLDSRTSREIVGLLAGLNRDRGLTVVMVSHEEALVREFAHEIVRLRDGRVVATAGRCMRFADAVEFALASLGKRRLRTFLTAAGVMIGIGALRLA